MKSPALVLTKYQPNFDDPRVKARVLSVLEYCKPLLLQRKAKPISSAQLTKIFGNQKSALAARLRSNLLMQTGTYKPGQKSYSYLVKKDGYIKLAAAIGLTLKGDADLASELYGGIAAGTEIPEYTEPTLGARRYHAVQNLPKKLRAEVFKGWYDYDIEAAAPTLVHQLACRAPDDLRSPFFPYPSVARLVHDRAGIRKHLAELTGLDGPAVKGVLIGLFFGANLAGTEKQAIFRILNGDLVLLKKLKTDQYIKDLMLEVKFMWSSVFILQRTRSALSAAIGGHQVPPKPESKGKHRMSIYLKLERQVMDVIQETLKLQGVTPFLIHDGFMTKGQINKTVLEDAVRERTGYVIKLSEARVGMQKPDIKDWIDGNSDFAELMK